ncbi:MAG: hypothetical protein JST54_12460 [Deltaproteobacteria bacterium]|nr:hypothetical protein [Deltaproteobacteria bacterium]
MSHLLKHMGDSAQYHHFDYWVTVRPSEDVPGQWVAHCLNIDVVSQGNSLAHAFEMIMEASLQTVMDDVAAGRDPDERRAPQEFWTDLWKTMPKTRTFSQIPKGAKIACAIAQLYLAVPRELAKGKKKQPEPIHEVPAFFTVENHASHA